MRIDVQLYAFCTARDRYDAVARSEVYMQDLETESIYIQCI